MSRLTPEQKIKESDRRRKKYKEDPEYREKVRLRNKAYQSKKKERYNTDKEYRRRVLFIANDYRIRKKKALVGSQSLWVSNANNN